MHAPTKFVLPVVKCSDTLPCLAGLRQRHYLVASMQSCRAPVFPTHTLVKWNSLPWLGIECLGVSIRVRITSIPAVALGAV